MNEITDQTSSSTSIIPSHHQQQQQSSTPNGIGNLSSTSLSMHPLSIASPIPIPICSMSPSFSSQQQNDNSSNDCSSTNNYSNYYEDSFDDDEHSSNQMTPNDCGKKFSITSTISVVSDSGNESIVDEELIANEKILDYFARDNSKTVKLARRRLSGHYQAPFNKYRSEDNDQYDTDDESTLSESSFPSSPSEYGTTPRGSEAIFDFEHVCAAIDEKLNNKDQILSQQENEDMSSYNNDYGKNNSPELKGNEASFNDSNLLEEFCDNERRNSSLIRSTSLKTGKTPPGTPGGKKIVRFADALGLDLASVRHIFYDAPYQPPLSAFKSLELDDEDRDWLLQTHNITSTSTTNQQLTCSNVTNIDASSKNEMNNPTTFRMLFCQPSSDPIRFMELVRSNKVCLENCLLSGPVGSGHVFTISCVIRVLNICFKKKVILRYTTNEWLTWSEVVGTYIPNSHDEFSDKFSVQFDLAVNSNGHQTMMPGQRLLFAVKYQTNDCGEEHWDNNMGMNYALIYQRS